VTTRLTVRVKPNARVSALREQDDGSWVAEVKALPVDGKANEELRALVARRFGVAKARVTIRHGASSRAKLVEIDSAH
jgi:uncharacterized protein YggU (UPF0235/DUF167 family)